MIKVGVITVSDKGSKGEREDLTVLAIKEVLDNSEYKIEYYNIVPDEISIISDELLELSDNLKLDLIITNGGTGFSKRDVTPEATRKVIQKEVPGIPEAMRSQTLNITPKAMLSRGICGIRGLSLILNLPGSPKGARENLEVIMPALKHGIEILKGEAKECAR